LALTVVCATLTTGAQEPSSEKPITISFQRSQSKWILIVNPDPTPGEGTLTSLSTLLSQRGEDYPIVALVDDSAKISDIGAASGVAAKAGFKNIRTFVVHREFGNMVEIKYCKTTPISPNPPVGSDCTLSP
jgi:hypothetical protein